MSETERESIRQILKRSPNSATRWKRGAENALVSWAVTTLLFVFASGFIAWLARKAFHAEIGLHTTGAIWVIVLGTLGCALYAIISSVRWIKKWPDARKDYQADLEGGQVIEETYEFTAAKRFQEPEHGGLFYFLRTTDDKVFVLWDYESQNHGVQDENPLNGKFQPRTELLIIRAPKSDIVIDRRMSGDVLDAGEPHALSVGPKSWPEDEACCKIPWEELEKRLNRKSKKVWTR